MTTGVLKDKRGDPDPRLLLSIGDVKLDVRSDLPEIITELAELYPENATAPVNGPTIELEVRRTYSKWHKRRYLIFADGVQIGGEHCRDEVFPFLEWGTNLRVMATRAEYVQLHAASMEHGGSGFIFAGPSGCGKSTLAAGLMARGWNYLCDEFALIDTKTSCLRPFPKALCIKAGSFPIIRRLGVQLTRRHYIKARKGRVVYISPGDLGCQTIGKPAPVQFIIFPEYAENRRPRLYPLSRARALIELGGCVFNRHVFDDQALSILSEVVRRAECFRLETGRLEETCELLESQLLQSLRIRQPSGAVNTDPPAGRNTEYEGFMRSGLQQANEQCGITEAVDESRPIDHADKRSDLQPSRREALRRGAKLAYVAPTVISLSARQAFATASNPSGLCLPSGEICEIDDDCCSAVCDLGVCEQ